MTWLVLRFSLDKRGGKAGALGEADDLGGWMRASSGAVRVRTWRKAFSFTKGQGRIWNGHHSGIWGQALAEDITAERNLIQHTFIESP